MSVSLQGGQRPPFVMFEARVEENRAETIAKGRRIDREVDWVVVRQAGSKDTAEFVASVWLEAIKRDPGYQPEWVDRFHTVYDQWKRGQEPTPEGTHVSQWPAINKGQASILIAANLPTVEDLAAANESALARIGIGARELQNKAKEFLRVANDTGKAAEELSVLRARAAGQDDLIAKQAADLKRLSDLVEGLTRQVANAGVEKALAQAPAEAPADTRSFL